MEAWGDTVWRLTSREENAVGIWRAGASKLRRKLLCEPRPPRRFEITYDPVARHVTHLPPFIVSRARVGTRGASPTLDLGRVAECRSKEGKNGNNESHNLVE